MKKKILFGLGVVLIAAAMFVNVKVNSSNRLAVIDNNLVSMINANEAHGEKKIISHCNSGIGCTLDFPKALYSWVNHYIYI